MVETSLKRLRLAEPERGQVYWEALNRRRSSRDAPSRTGSSFLQDGNERADRSPAQSLALDVASGVIPPVPADAEPLEQFEISLSHASPSSSG